jgi:anti-sigma factor (TIGR02949 family)
MTDCNETIRELDAFLDGELTDGARVSIHEHLSSCTDCLSAFDFHAELRVAIQRKCQTDEMPAGLMLKIESCLDIDLNGDGQFG